jgi:hypothetical protein
LAFITILISKLSRASSILSYSNPSIYLTPHKAFKKWKPVSTAIISLACYPNATKILYFSAALFLLVLFIVTNFISGSFSLKVSIDKLSSFLHDSSKLSTCFYISSVL